MASAIVASSLPNGPAPGQRFVDSIDPEDPARAKELMKPVDVREDMKQMEARARVSQILNSQAFREQLEEIIETQTDPVTLLMDLKSGPHHGSWVVPQQLFQLVLPAASPSTNSLQSTLMAGRGPITPVTDVRGVNSALYTKGERSLRCKVASVCRLLDLFGWVHGMQGSVTARASEVHFLANPVGLMYGEMTAGSLVKVDAAGSIVDSGITCMGTRTVNLALHLALYAANPDVGCIMHLLTSSALAISLAKCGLLPISQEAMVVGDAAYFNSDALSSGVVDQDLTQLKTKVIFVRNHGMMVLGRTVEEAMLICYTAMLACDTQVRVMPLGIDNIILPSESARQQAAYIGRMGSEGVDAKGMRYAGHVGHQRQAGELEFEAWMRLLDSAGYRTGYVYQRITLQNDKAMTARSEEESLAATLALKYYEDADKQSTTRKEAQSKQRRQQKVHWLASGQGKRSDEPIAASPKHAAQDLPTAARTAEANGEDDSAHAATVSNVSIAAAAAAAAGGNDESSHRTTSEPRRATDAEQPVPKARSAAAARPKSEDPSRAYERAAAEGLLRTASGGLQPNSPSYLPSEVSNGAGAEPGAGDKSLQPSAEADEKKKKKSKFRIPSFSKGKQDRKDKSKSTTS